MPQAARTFRIFVSSTFEDLKEEIERRRASSRRPSFGALLGDRYGFGVGLKERPQCGAPQTVNEFVGGRSG